MSLSTSCHLEAYEEEKNEGNHTEAATEGLPPVQAALLREQTQHYRKTHYFHKEGIVSCIIFFRLFKNSGENGIYIVNVTGRFF